MAENGNTAEHELLKTIEGKSSAIESKAKGPSPQVQEQISEFVSRFKEILTSEDFKEKLTLGNINKALLAVILVLALIFSSVLIKGLFGLNNVPRFKISNLKKISQDIKTMTLPLEDYSFYKDVLLGRNIFTTKEETAEEVVQAVPGIHDMVKSLKLVGISWDEDPNEKFAMIEDTTSELTYYVQEGETLQGFIIKKIMKDKLVLEYNNNEVELR